MTIKPVVYWVPDAEQFCIPVNGEKPFAKAWEPLFDKQTVESLETDALRYRKLQRWMSSNVKEGWGVVEQLGAVAAWQGWDEMDQFLDSLEECNVGLCETKCDPTQTL